MLATLLSLARFLLILTSLTLGSPAADTGPTQSASPTMTASNRSHSHTNRLAQQKSPYLLQHQHNPVDWFPWGSEAFEKARKENKPIFLSIGYSTCHWCHVMERESFEDPATAQLLNESFVSIKVDREERPDVDKIYMTFVQAMTGSGGWPLNVFITPELKPFFGGTYWPPERKYGKSSFRDVLQQVQNSWKEKRTQISESAASLHEQLGGILARQATNQVSLGERDLHQAGVSLKEGYDRVNGGFGKSPKFPTPSHPLYLLRYGVRFQDKEAIEMVLHTCRRMAAGGIYDQLGGGFSRYSVDEKWLVPHFEKMLYDNAQLIHLYLDAFLVSGDAHFADIVHDILRYLLRDMTHAEGGFYSAEDADSEGKEGKFYCWTQSELESLLNPEQFKVVARYYGITEKGNFHDHSDPQALAGQNVLSQVHLHLSSQEKGLLEVAKEKMLKVRAGRVRPHLDDKILASWNGLMLGAVARAGVVLRNERYIAAAEKNASFLREKLWDDPHRALFNRWRDGERGSAQLQDSYAFLLGGMIELYQATLEPKHLEFAVKLARSMVEKFYDTEEGGFWQSLAGSQDLILRVKEDYDGAEPSGNSVAVLSLLKLAAITDEKAFRDVADKTLALFAQRLKQQPHAAAFLLLALDFAQETPRRVVLTGAREQWLPLLQASHSLYQPNKVILGTEGPVEPFAKTLQPQGGQATAYVCLGTLCKPPVQTTSALVSLLK